MADFREYVSFDTEQEPTTPEPDDIDCSKQLAEVARQVFHLFAIDSPPIYPYTECVETHSDRGFTVRVYMVGENFGAKIVLHSVDTMEAGQVHAPGTPVDEIVLGLLESCRTVIYRDYHPDPNMHECLWTRHQWSKKGRDFLELVKLIESIPRVRNLFLRESHPIPTVMYHMTSVKNRQSIIQYGLRQDFDQSIDKSDPDNIGGIFLSSHPRPDPSSRTDIWQVDVRGLPVEEDWTTSVPPELPEDETWHVVYQSIPPNRLKLISRH